jgi:hypothetical protein
MFMLAMLCYYSTSSLYIAGAEMSGIISLLTCAIFDGHYAWHNLSQQGKTTTPVTTAFIGAAMEAAVYSYIGIGLYAIIPTWWSWNFIMYEDISSKLLIVTVNSCFTLLNVDFAELVFNFYFIVMFVCSYKIIIIIIAELSAGGIVIQAVLEDRFFV